MCRLPTEFRKWLQGDAFTLWQRVSKKINSRNKTWRCCNRIPSPRKSRLIVYYVSSDMGDGIRGGLGSIPLVRRVHTTGQGRGEGGGGGVGGNLLESRLHVEGSLQTAGVERQRATFQTILTHDYKQGEKK
jgi:hypothetical protein